MRRILAWFQRHRAAPHEEIGRVLDALAARDVRTFSGYGISVEFRNPQPQQGSHAAPMDPRLAQLSRLNGVLRSGRGAL